MSRLEPRKYSERLGVIDPGQLFEVAERFDLGEVLSAEPPVGGLFGQNLFLTTTKGDYVLRGHPHGHVQLTKERRVADFIDQGSSLPAPWPYVVSDDTETFGWTYAIMPRLEGESGAELWEAANEADRLEICKASGEALARLHEADGDFFGPYDAQLDDFIEMDDFADWLLHRLEHWRSMARAVNSLSTEAEVYIDELIETCSPALAEPFAPVLVHHDFKPGNLNFERTSHGFEPTGIFDLFEAYLADGEEDIVRMLWTVRTTEERKAFVDAYTAHRPLRPGAADRLALYALSDWLVIWEYGHRMATWFDDTSFMERIQPIIKNAREIGS
ncbi:MAG TPA: aminoglycoside phosphotransferase family protein [Actinomycetota bacterium]|nr:aminoglycoside phosphotransferase family protein [Actinomycetota bacterium]